MSVEAVPLKWLESRSAPRRGWELSLFRGRLAELSGGPAASLLSLTFRLVWEAQWQGEPVAWISTAASSFFPPDVARVGVDLSALVVVRVRAPWALPKAADTLVRSGGFGLVVLDLGRSFRVPLPVQSRLAGLARKQHVALVALTEKGEDLPSLGPMVSLRAALRTVGKPGEPFQCEARILKDKLGCAGWRHAEARDGPPGLC